MIRHLLLFFIISTGISAARPPAIILCFHDIDGRGRYSIKKKSLITILDLFKDKYHVSSLKDWYSLNLRKQPIAGKPSVILTFDDGFPSLFNKVIPILKRYDYGATVFIYLERHSFYSRFYKHLSKLPDKFEIGSHSFSHSLLKINSKSLFEELYLSKKKLEYLVKRDIVSWAWPYGFYSPDLIKQAENAGYLLQVSTDSSIVKPKTNYNNMARFTVQQPDPVRQVRNILKIYDKEFKRFLDSFR